MITTNQSALTWQHFEEINSDKRVAFEKMCRSLFLRTKVLKGENLHSDPNHPGVEVAPVYSKDSVNKISFQAKYFDNAIGYDQIKGSVKTAVSHYKGELDIIYLYCNKDITSTSKSYNEIEIIASAAGISIVLVTGDSIFEEASDYPQVLARYFGKNSLNEDWFNDNLKLSLDNLGQRYNSKFNVDTDAKNKLDIFLKNDSGINIINRRKYYALEELKHLQKGCDGSLKNIVSGIITAIDSLDDISGESALNVIGWHEELLKKNQNGLSQAEFIRSQALLESNEEGKKSKNYVENQSKIYTVNRIVELLNTFQLTAQEEKLIRHQVVFVTGEMGTGKSQLLAVSAKNDFDNGRMSLLVLGQTIISSDPVEAQIVAGLVGIDYSTSLEDIFGVMDEIAYLNNTYSAVYIDAINESRDREVWKAGINRLVTIIEKYKNLRLVISLRSGFEQLLYSEKIQNDLEQGRFAYIQHFGLWNNTLRGMQDFLSNYGVPISPEYYLQREMTNPLFLTWFCQTYTGEDFGLDTMILSVLNKADAEASKDAGFSEPICLLKDLLIEFVENTEGLNVTKKDILRLKTWDLYGVNNKIAYLNAIQRAGVLASYARNGVEYFYFGYNLLEDFVRAYRIMDEQTTKEEVRDYCKRILLGIDENGYIENEANGFVFAVVSAMYSVRYGEECIDVIDGALEDKEKQSVIEEYFKSFSWRKNWVSFEQFLDMINKYSVDVNTIFDVFIECATKEKCPINADGLTKLLMGIPLNKRDYIWTIYVNELSESDSIISFAYDLETGSELKCLSDKQAYLLMILYTWMLSSTNRVIRDRVSKAMIEVLKLNFGLCVKLLRRFNKVNDPYIIQRLFGVVFGAVMKRVDLCKEEFEELVLFVYTEIFAKEIVYPDILLRDYARLIVERFLVELPEKKSLIETKRIRPPYNSEPIPEAKTVNYGEERYHEKGIWRLLYSMKFNLDVEGVGMYGDFGRYTFQSALRNFTKVDEKNIYYYALEFIFTKLGYSNELFGEYDSERADFDRHVQRKIERIGKKYEWIAMYNILARLSDFCRIERRYDVGDKKTYEGPWELYIRDFDPTLNARLHINREEFPVFDDKAELECCFIDSKSSKEEILAWLDNDDVMFYSFPSRFIRFDKEGREWVSMYLYQEAKKTIPGAKEFSLSIPYGEQHIWTISSMNISYCDRTQLEDGITKNGCQRVDSGMNATRDCYSLYSREYAWSPAYISEFADDEIEKKTNKPFSAVINVMWEAQQDASQEETTSFLIPSGDIITALGLYQKQYDGVFYYEEEIAVLDTCVLGDEHGELLIKKDVLDIYLEKTNAIVFWDVVGEKQFFCGEYGQEWERREGCFLYSSSNINGNIHIV